MKQMIPHCMQQVAVTLIFLSHIPHISALEEISHPRVINSAITTEVSLGELIDKITILMIKEERITDPQKRRNVKEELTVLLRTKKEHIPDSEELTHLMTELLEVNKRLWDIEDLIRDKERAHCFDLEFIKLARSVYIENDERFRIKRDINKLLGSHIVEEKSYKPYK